MLKETEWESQKLSTWLQIMLYILFGVLLVIIAWFVFMITLPYMGSTAPALVIVIIMLVVIEILLIYAILDFNNPNWGWYKGGIQQARREFVLATDSSFVFKTVKRWINKSPFTIKQEILDSYINSYAGYPYGYKTPGSRADTDNRRWLEIFINKDETGTLVSLYEKAGALSLMRSSIIKDEITRLADYLKHKVREIDKQKIQLIREVRRAGVAPKECSFCGNPLPPASMFCQHCGASIDREE